MLNQMKAAFLKLRGKSNDGMTQYANASTAEPVIDCGTFEPSSLPAGNDQETTTMESKPIVISPEDRKTVYRWLRRHPGSSKRAARAGIALGHAMVDAILEDGMERGDLTMVTGARNAQRFWLGQIPVPVEKPTEPDDESSPKTAPESPLEPLHLTEVQAGSETPVEAQSSTVTPEVASSASDGSQPCLGRGEHVFGTLLAGLASPGCEAKTNPSRLTPPIGDVESPSVPVVELGTESKVMAVEPIAAPPSTDQQRVINFLGWQTCGLTVNEISGGTGGINRDIVKAIMDSAVQSGAVTINEQKRYRIRA